MRSASGALQAAAVDGGQNCGTLRVYDIETLARAGKVFTMLFSFH